ncbi:alpha/beta fold hydrolase [Deinococcus sp. PESE-38]
MHVERYGQGKLLACLHGWGMNGRVEQADFEPFFERRSGWQRLYIDLPGMGQSPAQADIHDLDDMLSAVLAVLDGETSGQPYALSGTSAGGYLARGVVARRPEQVTGLLLRVPRVHPDWQPRELPPTPAPQSPSFAAALADKERRLVQPALQACDTNFVDAIRNDPQRYSFRQVPEQQPFSRPTLIVTGRHDTVTGYRDAWSLLEHYPHASFAVLDRAGHEWPLPEPGQQTLFSALVGDWLDRVEETLS